MRRLPLVSALLLLAGCPEEKTQRSAAAIPQDTTPVSLESLKSAIPPAVPDTFTRPRPGGQGSPTPEQPTPAQAQRTESLQTQGPPPQPAPPTLVEAVRREQSFTKFCYQEFGQKSDPSLSGGVAMIVVVDRSGITDAFVEDDSWSSGAGKTVNSCLNEKAAKAWKAAAGAIKPGRYVVQLSFRPS